MKTEDLNNVCRINVNITDILLTPLACASLVNEILKGILYQKCQIPYPYHWMKTMVDRKRQKTETNEKINNYKAINHYALVSSVFDKLETAMQQIKNEFAQYKTNIKKILFVFGTSPHTANEIISINFASLVEGHHERNHISQLNKYQQKILRNIFLSQDWLNKIDATLPCTNIYLYIIKNESNKESTTNNMESISNNMESTSNNTESTTNIFVPTTPLTFSSKAKHVKISINSETAIDTNCCGDLSIFQDNSENQIVQSKKCDMEETEENITWYKYKDLVKGFKDCFVNKKSVSELW